MSLQLDLFLDSRSVVLANEAAGAISARDAALAAQRVAELRSVAPDYPNLHFLETLARELAEWQQPPGDVAQIMSAIVRLENVIVPAATQAVGAASKSILDPLFRDLAQASRGLPYEPAHAKAHRARLSLCCGVWAAAEQAALDSPRAREIPDALHWLTIARYRQHGLAAARPTLFALAWHEPQRFPSVLGELGDELLDRDFRSFERACEWAEIEAPELPAWFPAWYVLEHPAVAIDLQEMDVMAAPPAKAARLLARILEVERQGDWKKLVALREPLRLLSSDLFSLYMTRRVVRYSR